MFTPRCTPLMRSFVFLGAAVLFAAASAHAQNQSTSSISADSTMPADPGASAASNESSSNVALTESSSNPFALSFDGAAAAPASGGGAAAGAGQSGGSGHGIGSHLAFEAGGGFNAPAGSTQKQYITWGGQFLVGAGYRFGQRLTAMLEYQFLDDKLPGPLIAETGANGGDAHIWSFAAQPIVSLFPKATNDVYATAGYGFYRKVTNFTDPEEEEYCEYYCGIGVTNEVVGHFSSNQGGWNIGGGFSHRMGGLYGDGKMKLFAEVRYLDVLTPGVNHLEPNGLSATTVAADTKVVPVSFGVRF
jgi:hypothetical protein